MKRKIQLQEYAGTILEQLSKGALLTTCVNGKANTMSIGWAMLGRHWGEPVFIAFIRESRYTKQLLDQNPEFTVNFPLKADCKEILAACGTLSGRDTDKFAKLGLTQVPSENISVPAIRELPLTLECKVIYKQEHVREALCEEALKHYPQSPEFPEGDLHTAYYGQILDAYMIE